MKRAQPEAGDQGNTHFELLGSDLHHVKAGFDSRMPAKAPDGAQRFPRRSKEQDVPKESLADRLRQGRRKGK
jgi:hypothetical protein